MALVRHLVTNNVSAQYHCVFDDKFEAVTGMLGLEDSPDDPFDEVIERIWHGLFTSDGCRDCDVY